MAEDFILYGVPATILVAAFVQVIKRLFPQLKENDQAQIVVALGVGLLLSFLAKLGQMFPGVSSWGLVVISGLLVAMTAMGFYDTAHKANQARKAQKK